MDVKTIESPKVTKRSVDDNGLLITNMFAKYGIGRISLQYPVTYQLNVSIEFVTRKDLSLFLFAIITIANFFTSGAPFPSSATICLLSGLPMAMVVLLPASYKVNLLNDDSYRLDSATVIMSSFGQIEQGAH